ncbi:sigma-70 family RNA polymerase sigma factor [Mucilaginibacter sp.]|uniref:RNA polymerase sigma factor n=1 Tax=Mucilaginibacter sp. TaxID=1882438 RepID=UPI003266DDB8
MLNKSLTDSQLIEAILNNDEQAFNQLFERYWSRVYAVAYKCVKDEELSLEITHDIFINIWNKRSQLHIENFKAYVVTAASYHGIRKRQTLKATPIQYVEDYEYVEDYDYATNHRSDANEGEAKLCRHDFDIKVESLLNDLPKKCREIYLLSRKDNLTITEIAEKLNISKRTVENQLTSALKHLRTSLKYIVLLATILKL